MIMKRKCLWLLAAVLLTTANTAFAQNKDDAPDPPTIALTAAEQQFVSHSNDFAFRLFREARGAESTVMSPLSVTFALGMLNNGATGPTRDEINTLLGESDADVVNGFCRKLISQTATLDPLTQLSLSNAVFLSQGNELRPAFAATARDSYDAELQVRDFYDGQTLDAINDWAATKTGHMVEQVLSPEEFKPYAVCYLLNALSFKGQWTSKFDDGMTQKYAFDYQNKTAMMMHQQNQFLYAETSDYQSIILPYGNRAYQMTIFLPQQGILFDDMLATLDANSWQQPKYDVYNVDVLLPRFETATELPLTDIMKQLGIHYAFSDTCGFNELCQDLVYIDMMKQSAKIQVDEEGTTAAAVTTVELNKWGIDERYFWADRPFLYVISEQSTGAIVFMGQYMGEEPTNVRRDINLTADERLMVSHNNDFAFRLFRETRGQQNSVISPLSITFALGMLNNGATGQTRKEICDVLGFEDADGINQFCRKLLSEAPTLDEETAAEIANTIFVNSGNGYELQPGFTETADTYYDAQPEARDFHDGETMDVINDWANTHTHGMIPWVLNEESFNPDAASYLLNAIYFKGAWTSKFDAADTRDLSFNGGEPVPMMHQNNVFVYDENERFQTVQLPYGNGAYLMTVFLPREGVSIGDVIQQMDDQTWRMHGSEYKVNLFLPRFETEVSHPLREVMSRLGMSTAFSPAAEFPNVGNSPLYISDMRQKAKIKVNEKGTEAAAVTTIEAVNSEPQAATFRADRPFFYIISEHSTGAIFFIGQYVGEGQTAPGPDAISPIEAQRTTSTGVFDLSGRRLSSASAHGIYIVDGRKVIK